MKIWIFLLLCISQSTCVMAKVFPIVFSIPEQKIVQEMPEKTQDFAFLIPGKLDTYMYDSESDYYNDYQRSYFAITCKKGGWDCLRHYEILANGCIPYFLDLDLCDEKTLFNFPKDLILEAMHLDGVSYMEIDHSKFDKARYDELLARLLAYTRKHLTSRNVASYLLDKVEYKGDQPILFLSGNLSPDYLRCLTLIGLKEAIGEKLVDYPKIPHIYKGYPFPESLYGKGFSYTSILEDAAIDRTDIGERIKNREFGLIIYGTLHRGLPFHDLVCDTYDPEKIVYLCGEDIHECSPLLYLHDSPLFLREFELNECGGLNGNPNLLELKRQFDSHWLTPSDINEHLPALRRLARESASVIEIGLREMVSTWGLLQGLAENRTENKSYIGIDLNIPPIENLFLADRLAEKNGISFQFWQKNDFGLEIESADLLFIDSWHTYRHLTYELETFSPKIRKFIAMHDTSEPWGNDDEPLYQGTVPNYPRQFDQNKKGLWPAVQDFLSRHPEWRLKERRLNNHGFTVLERAAKE